MTFSTIWLAHLSCKQSFLYIGAAYCILYIVTFTVSYFCRPSLLRAMPEQPLLQSAKTFYTQPAAAGEEADHLGIFVSLACSLGCFLLKKIELAKK